MLGHIRWVNWPPYPHLPMWAPDTETVLKLRNVLFGFYHKKKKEIKMYPGRLANQPSVRWGPIIFDLHIFAFSHSEILSGKDI